MPQLTRRLASDAGQPQQWLIWYDGINVGQIRERHGAPFGSDAWEWFCGFYPGSQPSEQEQLAHTRRRATLLIEPGPSI